MDLAGIPGIPGMENMINKAQDDINKNGGSVNIRTMMSNMLGGMEAGLSKDKDWQYRTFTTPDALTKFLNNRKETLDKVSLKITMDINCCIHIWFVDNKDGK